MEMDGRDWLPMVTRRGSGVRRLCGVRASLCMAGLHDARLHAGWSGAGDQREVDALETRRRTSSASNAGGTDEYCLFARGTSR